MCMAALITGLVVIGGHAAYADIEPGWDEPWDPPNYYHPTNISWADTNNPSYFYRDLGWQGGSVLDTDRLKEWVTTVSQCVNWLQNATQILDLKILNSLPLSQGIFGSNQQKLAVTHELTEETYKLVQSGGIVDSNIFRKSNAYEEGEFDREKQAETVEKAAEKVAEASAAALADYEDVNKQLDELLYQAANAKGERELAEINGQIEALKEEAWARRNALLANYANMNTITQVVENDERLRQAAMNKEAMINIQDPYNRSEYQEKIVPKPEPIGFVKFKD